MMFACLEREHRALLLCQGPSQNRRFLNTPRIVKPQGAEQSACPPAASSTNKPGVSSHLWRLPLTLGPITHQTRRRAIPRVQSPQGQFGFALLRNVKCFTLSDKTTQHNGGGLYQLPRRDVLSAIAQSSLQTDCLECGFGGGR